jgi:DNA-binding response OmpR family regulator
MSRKISFTVDDGLSVRKYVKVVLHGDGLRTIKKVELNPMVILLVEDDLGVRFLIWKLLKAEGFTVLTAGDGKAALEASRNYPGSIDLLLSDVEMPWMGGLELYQNISAERLGIKVLMMSGELWGSQQASMNGLPFLQKPFSRTAIRDSIEALLGPIPPLPGPLESVEHIRENDLKT